MVIVNTAESFCCEKQPTTMTKLSSPAVSALHVQWCWTIVNIGGCSFLVLLFPCV